MPILWMLLVGPAMAQAPWAADLQTGDCQALLQAIPAPATDIERYVAGSCKLRTGDPKGAAQLFDAVTGTLAGHAKAELARAQLDAGDAAAARASLDGVDLPGDGEVVLKARAQLGAGDPAGARRTLGSPTGALSEERLYWTGEVLVASGVVAAPDGTGPGSDRGDPATLWRTLWTAYPTSAWADKAAVRLGEIGHPVPDYATAEGRALALTRAKKLLKIQQAPMAIPLLDGIHAVQPFAGGEVAFMAEALYDAKLYARAVEWFARSGASTTSPVTAFHEALATARAGDYPGAATRYAALIARWPTSKEADEAAWKPGYMEYDAGHLEAATGLFATYINTHPQGKFLWDARWLRAWAFYKLGRTDDALVALDKVIAGPNVELAAAARYWKARATGDTAGLVDVITRYPDTSYAWFAAARTGRTWPAQQTADPPAFSAAFLAAHPVIRDARTLADAGLGRLALVSKTDVDSARGSSADALAMAGLLLDIDRIREAQDVAGPYASTPAGRALALPRPYRAVIDRIAAATGLPALLPYAIMNAESGLDPTVTSPAGARGLMQLMPLLASDLARDRVAGFVVDDLYRAGVNARLGSTELSLLHQRFSSAPLPNGGSLPMVIAGYNGGADAVDRWVKGYATQPDADRFAEDISFTETRRYVRKVLGYLQRYRRVYGD